MTVRLPKQCSGTEIVEAFKLASTFEEGSELGPRRWRPKSFVKEYQFNPGSVKQQVVRTMCVVASPSKLKRKILTGRTFWEEIFNPKITLRPVTLEGIHNEIEVEVSYYYGDMNQGQTALYANNPAHPRFEDIRPYFERILGDFFSRLQPIN